MAEQPDAFGPWARQIPVAERRAQLRSMQSIALMILGPRHPLVGELRAAERDRKARLRALRILDALPPLKMRRVLATFATVSHDTPPRKEITP